ncbi:Agd3-related carbohydrate deacetylase [Burkholderia sp. PU8-34]
MSAIRTPSRLPGLLARSLAVAGLCAAANVSHAVPADAQIDLKILVLINKSAPNYPNTPELLATRAMLDHLGVPYLEYPYDNNTPTLPQLETAPDHALYQGIIMPLSDARFMNPATGALATMLTQYQFKYNVRLASVYTWPGDTGCLQYVGYRDTTSTPLNTTLTTTGKTLFPYMNAGSTTGNPLPVTNAWTYFMSPLSPPPTGVTVTSQIQAVGTNNVTYPVAATCLFSNVTPTPAGQSTSREIMAISFDNNPYLIHSMTLSYGIVNWVTRGLFVGSRHVYMDPQVDDIGIPDEIFPYALSPYDVWYDVTTGQSTPGGQCPYGGVSQTTGMTPCEYRISGAEFDNVMAWQDNTNSGTANAGALKLTFAFNGSGFGTAYGGLGNYPPSGTDTLSTEVNANEYDFKWITHTYDHLLLEPNTTITPPTTVTSSQVTSELQNNDAVAQTIGFENYNTTDIVTPEISGLYWAPTLSALDSFGIKTLVSDSSKPTPPVGISGCTQPTATNGVTYSLPPFNEGKYNCDDTSIFEIPRYATALFYNVSVPDDWVKEYSYFYASPGGLFPTFPAASIKYGFILDKVSDILLSYLLTYDNRPMMFHQSNLRTFTGTNGVQTFLLADLLNMTLTKYNKYYKGVPIVSPYLGDTAGTPALLRTIRDYSHVTATLKPGVSITLDAAPTPPATSIPMPSTVTVPITGIKSGTSTETYGGQSISNMPLMQSQAYHLQITPAPAWQ